jgi:hypothetical protein
MKRIFPRIRGTRKLLDETLGCYIASWQWLAYLRSGKLCRLPVGEQQITNLRYG